MKTHTLNTFVLLFFLSIQAKAQFTGPQIMLPQDTAAMARGGKSTNSFKTGFMPFTSKDQLRRVYNGDYKDVKDAFQELQASTVAMPTKTLEATAFYVEMLSYIPGKSFGRFSFGTQLSQAEFSDTTRTRESIAMQKMMNGGGNIAFNFNRPLVFFSYFKGKGHFLLNGAVTAFTDIKAMNQNIHNPGIGVIPSIDVDFRLFANKSNRMVGNIFRMGLRGRGMGNFFNSKFGDVNDVDRLVNNLLIFTGSAYIGLGPLLLDVGINVDNKGILDGSSSVFRIGFQPVKW